MKGRPDNVPGFQEIKVQELEGAVDKFADDMVEFYEKEEERRDVGIKALNRIFGARHGTKLTSISSSVIGSVRLGGHSAGVHGGGIGLVVFKNHCIGISASPEIELLGHVARLQSTMDEHRDLFERWRIPCLGITIVGTMSYR